MYYAGIGSREAPIDVQALMSKLAIRLAAHGFILRSGAADGADSAFEQGCDKAKGKKEIYLPWRKFNGHDSDLCLPSAEALELTSRFHPNWSAVSPKAKMLHARNAHQVLGRDLNTPSCFVLCWTRNGSGQGGTGQAIRIANAYQIPVFDLGASLSVMDEVAMIVKKCANDAKVRHGHSSPTVS